MKNTFYLFMISFAVTFCSSAQLNDYKYIIVPKQFKLFNKANQHQTSTLLKHLFTTNGYTAIYDDTLPADLKNSGCLGLKAELNSNSSLFVTKVVIELKDCNGQVVFISQEGRSKEKEFRLAYSQAIREAFGSFKKLEYKYISKETTEEKTITVNFKDDVKSLDTETTQQPEQKNIQNQNVKQEATIENQSYKSLEPVPSNFKKKDKTSQVLDTKLEILYAQPTENGFQLVDSTPQIKYKLIRTSVDNVFLATQGEKNGVVLKKDNKWFFEHTKDGIKVLEGLNIKF